MCFAEIDWALPAVSLTQRLVEGGADEYTPTFGHGGLRRGQQIIWRGFCLGFYSFFTLFHTQVQGAVFIHLDEHILQAK